MLKDFLLLPTLLLLHALPVCYAIGLSVLPIRIDDHKSYSSVKNLANCIGYSTSKDDIITIVVKSGQKQQSQMLDLHVIDSDSNTLRSLHDISGEQMFMFTNLNNPIQLEDVSTKPPSGKRGAANSDSYNQLMSSFEGKSYLYVCFDNIYTDKSWSFQKQSRDVTFSISIRNITTLKETNYNKLAKHFNKIPNPDNVNTNAENEFKADFKESDFENSMNSLQSELEHVLNELDAAQNNIRTLVDDQKLLRDANEDIFESYTKAWLLLIICICAFSAFQLLYIKLYFAKRKII